MEANRPHHFVLRCYGYKDRRGKWCGVCLELNLAAEADSAKELRSKLGSMIESYIGSVLETDDKGSIPSLLCRKAPLNDWICYFLIYLLKLISQVPDRMTFNEIIPFRLAHSGC